MSPHRPSSDADATGRPGRCRRAPAPDWWHRDHPTFTALTGFFTGLAFVIRGAGPVRRRPAACSSTTRRPRACSRSSWSPWSCRSALVVAPRTRRFGIYMLIGMVVTAAGRGRRRALGWCSAFMVRIAPGCPDRDWAPMLTWPMIAAPTSHPDAAEPAPRRCRSSSTSRAAARSRRRTSPTSPPTSAPSAAQGAGPAGLPRQAALDPLLRPARRRPGRR